MDIELAWTFLRVVDAGSFAAAAEQLHVTQAAVSRRIQSLEEQLGCRLFVRNRAGAMLTQAGRQFQRHAALLVRTLEQARQDVGVPRGYRAALAIGGRFALWEDLLVDWMHEMRRRRPDVALRGEMRFDQGLMDDLVAGRIDIGVMYTPQSRPGLTVEHLLDEELVLVQRCDERFAGGTDATPADDYVYVKWGPEFYERHNMRFPERPPPPITAGIGWIGLRYIVKYGGSGFFPHRFVKDLLSDGTLMILPDAPDFSMPAYVVYADDPGELVRQSVDLLHTLARKTSEISRREIEGGPLTGGDNRT